MNDQKIQQLFNTYKDPSTNKIEIDGMQKFFEDLNVDPMDIVTLLISKHMKAQTMGTYSWEEFECGFKTMQVSSIQDLKSKLPSLYQELKNNDIFKDLYKYAFDFSKD